MGAIASTTLEVRFKSVDAQKLVNEFKAVGTEAQKMGTTVTQSTTNLNKAGTEVGKTTTKMKQSSTEAVSFGNKIKQTGSTIQGTVANVSTLTLSLTSLQRQYRDLGDAQLAVDKANNKVKSSTIALDTAEENLAKAVQKYGKNSDQAKDASQKLALAHDRLAAATFSASEAQERFGDIQQDFALTVIPTVIAAGGTMMGILDKLGGKAGLAGLVDKFTAAGGATGVFSKALEFLKGNIASVVGVLGGLGGALIILDIAAKAQTILDKMSTSDVSQRGGIIQAALGDPEQIKIQSLAIKEYDAIVKNTDIPAINLLYDAIFGTKTVQTAAKNAGILDKQNKILKEAAVAAIDLGSNFKMSATDYAKAAETMLKEGKSLSEVMDYLTKESFIKQEDAVVILDLAYTNFNKTLKETGRAYDTLDAAISGKAITDTFFPPNTQAAIVEAATTALGGTGQTIIGFMENEIAEVEAANINQKIWQGIFGTEQGNAEFADKLAEFGAKGMDAIQQKIEAGKAQGKDEWFTAAFGETIFPNLDDLGVKFTETEKIGTEAAKNIADANKKAAMDAAKAWEKALAAQTSGIDKIVAAWEKAHPKATPGQTPSGIRDIQRAEAGLQNLQANLGRFLDAPAAAKEYVTKFTKTMIPAMGPVAQQMFQPIVTYVQQHAGEAPELWLSGFLQVLGTGLPSVEQAAGQTFAALPAAAETAATQTTTALGTIDTTKMKTAMQPGLDATNEMTTALNNMPKQTIPKVTAKVVGTPAVTGLTKAIAQVKSKTVTVTVKAKLDQQLGPILARAQANVNLNARGMQHGYIGTVKRPTLLLTGEGGRQEDIRIIPRGSAMGRNTGGGGGSGTKIRVEFLPEQFRQFIRYSVSEEQGAQR